jgi:hypothetical protein
VRKPVTLGIIFAGASLVLAVSLVTVGATGATPPGTGTGTFSCAAMSGKVTFNPPLTVAGGQSDVATISLKASSCSGGSPAPRTVFITSHEAQESNAVANLTAERAITMTATYKSKPTVVGSTLEGKLSATVDGSNDLFHVAGTTTGSYAASGTMGTGTVRQSTSEILKKAASKGGLRFVTIRGGTVTGG